MPCESHQLVMEHYKRQDNWVDTVQDTIEWMQDKEKEDSETETSPQDTAAMTEWIIDRLDVKKHIPEGSTVTDLDLTRCVTYDLDDGLNITLHMVSGIKGNEMFKE